MGGASGPLKKDKKGHSQVSWIPDDVCPTGKNHSWHFTDCPGNFKFQTFSRENSLVSLKSKQRLRFDGKTLTFKKLIFFREISLVI